MTEKGSVFVGPGMDRRTCVAMIESRGLRQEFIDTFHRSPEAYFEEYSCKEPAIWYWVLSDFGIS